MDMQDEELDQLFSAKLKHLEVKPAQKVWKGIELELEGKRGKQGFAQTLRIAAGILVIISVGLFFLLRNKAINTFAVNAEKIPSTIRNLTQKQIANVVKPELLTVVKRIDLKPNNKQVQLNHAKPHTKTFRKHSLLYAANKSDLGTPLVNSVSGASNVPSVPSVPSVPLVHTLAATGTPALQPANDAGQEQIALQAVDESDKAPANFKTPNKKGGIRSLGGLINAVIAKVDKREDKLVEFTDTGDDGAIVTGVNLGILKVKKYK